MPARERPLTNGGELEEQPLIASDSWHDGLDAGQRTIVDETCAELREQFGAISAGLVNMGACIVDRIFAGDAKAALSVKRRRNPLWLALTKRAGTPSLRVPAVSLNVARRLGAWNRRVQGEAWALLDVPRKVVLLRLSDARMMAKGARHAIDMGADVDNLRKWVENTLAQRTLQEGSPQVVGRGTTRRVRTAFTVLSERLSDEDALDQFAGNLLKLEPVELDQARAELEASHKAIGLLLRRLGGAKTKTRKPRKKTG